MQTHLSLNRSGGPPEYLGAMTTTGRFDPSRAPGALLVEHCDIPDGMTLGEWRRLGGHAAAPRDAVGTAAADAPAGAVKAKRRGLRRVLARA